MSLGHLHVLLEVSIQVLYPFFIGLFVFPVLSHMSSLHILEIKPLSKVYWQICFPIRLVPFSFWWCFLYLCRSFLIWCSPICLFFHLFPLPLRLYRWKYGCVGCLRFSWTDSWSLKVEVMRNPEWPWTRLSDGYGVRVIKKEHINYALGTGDLHCFFFVIESEMEGYCWVPFISRD